MVYKTGNYSDQQPTTALKLGEKYCLTVEEAAAYFEIGSKTIRRIAEDHPDDSIFIRNGVKLLGIRPKFEEFLTKSEEICGGWQGVLLWQDIDGCGKIILED